MVDIHAHILPFVDDGSDSLDVSLEMLKREKEFGVTDVILTPHHRYDYKQSKEKIQAIYEQLVQAVKESGIEINLYLGQELLIDRDYKQHIKSDELITLNGGKYILIEFDLGFKQSFLDPVYELVRLGYLPIVAHFERYFYANLDCAYEIKSLGALIQVNASSILGNDSRKAKKLAKELFKHELVDFVASDVHSFRENLMGKSYAHILKKYGEQTAEKVFIKNAQQILKG